MSNSQYDSCYGGKTFYWRLEGICNEWFYLICFLPSCWSFLTFLIDLATYIFVCCFSDNIPANWTLWSMVQKLVVLCWNAEHKKETCTVIVCGRILNYKNQLATDPTQWLMLPSKDFNINEELWIFATIFIHGIRWFIKSKCKQTRFLLMFVPIEDL